MAYSPSNPPALIGTGTIIGRTQLWSYRSTDDATAVRAANYISNAMQLGMRVGDIVIVTDTDANPVTNQLMNVVSINATTGAGDLSDGVAVTATNT